MNWRGWWTLKLIIHDDSDNHGSEDTTSKQENTTVFKWKKKELEAVDVSFSLSGAEFTENLLPDNVDELSPFS
jgi:hypothetical protein